MALSVEEARELISIAEKKKRVIMVAHLLLYKPEVQKLLEYVKAGKIGSISFIEMRRAKFGKFRSQENVLWSFAPHDIAVILEMVGKPVENVFCQGLAVLQPGIEDNMHLHLVFVNNVQAHIHSSWLWPEDERKTVVVGTKGMLTYDEHEGRIWLHKKGVNKKLESWDEGKEEIEIENGDALENEAEHFLQCIKDRAKPLTDGQKGFVVVKVLVEAGNTPEAAKESNIPVGVNNVKPYSVNIKPKSRNYFVHESAYIDHPVKIGRGTQIWHFSHVMSGAEIGENCKIEQNVFIGRNVKIGNNVKIQNNVSVFEGVTLEDDVFCGPSCVFTNIKTPRSAYPRNTSEDYIKTVVKRGASIGANATIICGITIGEYALIGVGTVVTKNVQGYAVVYGNPAQVKGRAYKNGTISKVL